MTEPTAALAPGRDDRLPGPAGGGPVTRRRGLRAPLVTAATVGAGTVLVASRTPHEPLSYGFCPLLLLTGWACPLCGGLRGTYELAHLDLAGAWAMNPLWVLLAPALVVWWAVWFARRVRGLPGPRLPSWTPWALLGSLVVFGILRNLPPLAPTLTPWL
ncbi:DUF2752 domain-containing protein [Myceligenerans salitolerans]|uniref:DUF2752 domain-containing protein n=1 Tax=Myceligenerans salitolerans TaxID=1230528 RepID=A0ABS3IER5_9MICO|nr:DUF2752 domain-containing protein [Myceligenerans salitolerans]MBO0610502.1 DUF2752 domain-containing protein [Myceligenerans salitolerans]